MKINYFDPNHLGKEMQALALIEQANKRASEAVNADNVHALTDELGKPDFFDKEGFLAQETINKLLIRALVHNKPQCIDYLIHTNNSKYIADMNVCTTSAAKHIASKGDLEYFKSFMSLYNVDIYNKGAAESYDITRSPYLYGNTKQSLTRMFLGMDTPLKKDFDIFTYAVQHNHLHIMDYLCKEHAYNIHHNFELLLEVSADNSNNDAFDFLMAQRPHSAYFAKTFLIAISNKNKHIVDTLLHNNLVSIYDVLEQASKDNGIAPVNFFANNSNEYVKPPAKLYFNCLNLALRFFDKEIVDTLFAHGAKIAHHNYIAIENVTSKETFKYLALNYNLPNNHIVHTQMHKVLKSNDYEEICNILEKRDLASELARDLPVNHSKKPQHKI